MNNYVVIEPHDDDMVIGMGGTALKILEHHGEFASIQMTDGRHGHNNISPEELIKTRKEEKKKSNNYLEQVSGGNLDWEYIGAEDGRLMDFWENKYSRDQMVSELADRIDLYDPDAVFLPALNEDHPDHVASHLLGKEAISDLDSDPVAIDYRVWQLPFHETSPGDIETVMAIDVTEKYQEKLNSIKLHQSQDYPTNYRQIDIEQDLDSQLQEDPGEFSGYIDHRDAMDSYILGQLLGKRPGERVEILGSAEDTETIDKALEIDYNSIEDVSHGREGIGISPDT